MDEAETQGADLSRLKDLAPADLAAHWQERHAVPGRDPDAMAALSLKQRMRINHRRRASARAEAAGGAAGGATAAGMGDRGRLHRLNSSHGGTARRDRAPAQWRGGAAGPGPRDWMRKLDRSRSRPSAIRPEAIAAQHRNANATMSRTGIATDSDPARERLLSETLRPAPTTDAWRALADDGNGEIAAGLKGIALIASRRSGAGSACHRAGAARGAGDSRPHGRAGDARPQSGAPRGGGTDALGHRDRRFRRPAPRPHRALARFLCLLAEAADARFAPVPLLALLKHPFARAGRGSCRLSAPGARAGPLVPARAAARSGA